MTDQDTITYLLAAYSSDIRWNGELALASQRRLSDFVNDNRLFALSLSNVAPSTWENNAYRSQPLIDSLALLKQNIHILVPHTDPPPPPTAAADRVRKVPFPLTIHMATFTVTGEINLLPSADWLFVLTAAGDEFLALTKASLWHTKSQTQLEPNRKFMLVNRRVVLGLEPTTQHTPPTLRNLSR